MTALHRHRAIRVSAALMAGLLIVTTGSAASPAPRDALSSGGPANVESVATRGPVESDDAILLEGPADLTGEMVEAGGLLFVTTWEGAGGWSLWRTDGTSEGTRQLAVCRSVLVCGWSAPPVEWGTPLVAVGDLVYFGTSQGLWRSDGTDAGTFPIAKDADMNDRDRRPREPQGAERRRMSDEVCDVLADGSRLLVEASVDCMDPSLRQLWATDGTRRGTRMLAVALDADAEALRRSGTTARGRVFGSGGSLWVTDGTPKGTRRIASLGRPGRDVGPDGFVSAGGRAWLTVDDEAGGHALWVTDGSAAGTRVVGEIPTRRRGTGGWDLGHGVPHGDRVLLVADDGAHGREPWVAADTRDGTRVVQDIRPGPEGSVAEARWGEGPVLTRAGDLAYLVADDGIHGPQLWTTDGTADGTRMLTALPVDQGTLRSVVAWEAGDGALLLARVRMDREAPTEDDSPWLDHAVLWHSDGTPDGTSRLLELGTFTDDGSCDTDTWTVAEPLGDLLTFIAPEGDAGCRMWRSDGTAEGTFTLADGETWSLPAILDGQAFFITEAGGDETATSALWRTDGTPAGTVPVSRDGPSGLLATDDGLYFLAGGGSEGEEPCSWSSCRLWFLALGSGPVPGEGPPASPSAEDGPAPSPVASRGDLAAAFPAEVDGRPVPVVEREGPAWLASFDPADPDDAAAIAAIERFVRSVGGEVDGLTVASALIGTKGRPTAVTAIRVAGAEHSALVDAVIPFLFSDTVRPAREVVSIGGKRVLRVKDSAIPGAYPRYLYPDRDVVWVVEADAPVLAEVIGALP